MPPENPELRISRTVRRKQDIRRHLASHDMQSIEKRAGSDKMILRSLASSLYDKDPLIRWRAIEALGRASKIIWQKDPEKIHRQIRRILWLMNDESGGLCWNGPEAIGEIVYNIPALIDEYGPIMISFLNEEPFEAGTRRAISRITDINREIFSEATAIVTESLKDRDPEIRAFSVKMLYALHDKSARDLVKPLKDDFSPVEDYDFATGELKNTTISEFARVYLDRFRENRDHI